MKGREGIEGSIQCNYYLRGKKMSWEWRVLKSLPLRDCAERCPCLLVRMKGRGSESVASESRKEIEKTVCL